MNKQQQIEKVRHIIKDIKFTMMTTMSDKHKHHACPMTTQPVEDFADGIWFIGSKGTTAVQDLKSNQNVCLAYANPSDGNYVSITGDAELVDNHEQLKSMWNDMYEAFFEGINDPNIQLICVKPTEAEYWDGDGAILSFLKMGAAAVTGETVDDLGEHASISFA